MKFTALLLVLLPGWCQAYDTGSPKCVRTYAEITDAGGAQAMSARTRFDINNIPAGLGLEASTTDYEENKAITFTLKYGSLPDKNVNGFVVSVKDSAGNFQGTVTSNLGKQISANEGGNSCITHKDGGLKNPTFTFTPPAPVGNLTVVAMVYTSSPSTGTPGTFVQLSTTLTGAGSPPVAAPVAAPVTAPSEDNVGASTAPMVATSLILQAALLTTLLK